MKIRSFVFNWKNNYENAINLQTQLNKVSDCTVISSTENSYDYENWIEIGNDKYFVGQWNKALELFDPLKYDILYHCQADATTNDIKEISESALSIYDKTNWGIYAPNVCFSSWGDKHILQRNFMNIFNVHKVGGTDCTHWMIHKDVLIRIPRKFDETKNMYGHGVDGVYYNMCKLLQKPILKDYEFIVEHPRRTEYPAGTAVAQNIATKNEYATFLTNDIKWDI